MQSPTRHHALCHPRGTTRLIAAAVTALLLAACGAEDPDTADTDDAADVSDDVTDEAADGEAADDDAADGEAADGEPGEADSDTEEAAGETGEAADDEAETAGETGEAADDDAGDAGAGGSLDGELVVGGTAYDPQEAIVCEDDGAFPMDVELEYQAFAEGPDGRGQLDLLISELGADVSWSGEEGVFGDGLSDSDVTFTGDRVSGTATVTDALGSEDTLDISFDLAVPSSTIACRG